MEYARIDQYLIDNLNASIDELANFCRIPTISAQKLNLQEGAEAVSKMLKQRSFDVEIHQTAGAPIVFAERKGKSEKTLLFYNHYDVQPPEPLELWDSPAFEPEIRDGKLFGRGVSDDKGHVFLDALQIPVATAGIGYPGTQAHAPNENIVIDHYHKGAKHITRILKEFAAA